MTFMRSGAPLAASLCGRGQQQRTTDTSEDSESDEISHGDSLIELGPRLSKLSCNAKYAVSLNQIDCVEINNVFERMEDGATMYVLDIYLQYVQTGIPTQRVASPDGHDKTKNELAMKREMAKKPHYQLAYRYSDFFDLRRRLRATLAKEIEVMHNKWCRYCTRVSWLVDYSTFPSRFPLPRSLERVPFVHRAVVKHRQSMLATFIDHLVHGARDAPYRFGPSQCDGFVNTSALVLEFLSEPNAQQPFSGW